jgi:hypothetical protein
MFLTLLALGTAIPPERWVHIGGSTEAYQEYLDKESIKRSGDKVTLWTRRDFVRDQGTAWNEIEVDCLTKRDTILAFVRDAGGSVSHNVVRPHRESSPIRPGSVEERIFDLVCRL